MVRGTILAATAMTMVGSSIAVTGFLRDYPVYAGQGLRFAIAAVLLLVVLRVVRNPGGSGHGRASLSDWARITLLSAIGMVGFNVFMVAAERHADPALVGVIVGCAPVVIALLTPLLSRRSPSARLVLAGMIVAVGAALAHGLGEGSLLGVFLAICTMLGEVGFALLAVPVLEKLGALRVSTYACIAAVPLCLVGMVISGSVRVPTGDELLALIWLGVFVTAGAYVCWFTAVGALGAERAGLFTSLIPISAVGLTAALGTGTPTLTHFVGAVFVLAGLLVGMRTPSRTTTINATHDVAIETDRVS